MGWRKPEAGASGVDWREPAFILAMGAVMAGASFLYFIAGPLLLLSLLSMPLSLLTLLVAGVAEWWWPSTRGRRVRANAAAVAIAAVALFFVPRFGSQHLYTSIEERFAPVSVALEAYRSRNGRYPTSLEELVPDDLEEIPGCPGPLLVEGSPYKASPDGYTIECHTGLMRGYVYEGRSGRWYEWD
ncbi:MAG: hypothetical protein QM765_32815 [Myxococcales bacterium]